MPVGKVIGEFTIEEIHSDCPERLWDKTKEFSGITEGFFSDYFRGRSVGHAIEVRSARRYKMPKPIEEFLPSGVPPQSYAYLSPA